jgi:hypothetical protein
LRPQLTVNHGVANSSGTSHKALKSKASRSIISINRRHKALKTIAKSPEIAEEQRIEMKAKEGIAKY